ncbi:hypothetical protein AQJ23_34930 [Streptomyces antibioticus]|nr:hypothetical protein [Streptomyces antibioticus]KUN20167.1 hypothetical protein AQJ23_34930 [Streptomyces antibioticus]
MLSFLDCSLLLLCRQDVQEDLVRDYNLALFVRPYETIKGWALPLWEEMATELVVDPTRPRDGQEILMRQGLLNWPTTPHR